ncbi:pentapeptide repeat-containing protein [Streptomyces sp. NBC_01408]|uniref:pentapeptide repeat-containing protein n=1 Tax=Streptomyces sp. NBC_01408 TaxID=2903855 RepID=UPI00224ED84B|nr:pentapeptide repeat-containing protein [Streptomyces sp. NBC_01408]MCX4696209.1 SAV_2336 N-terminal domain-related protein [Streptomyces sp. NBC_01408]
MIEELLAAFAEGAEDSGPRPGVGAEEIADILWLAARVDPAGARPSGPRPDDATAGQPPAAGPGSPGAGADAAPEDGAGGEPAVQLYPGPVPDPAGKPADATGGRRGSALRLPRAASLDDPLALMRSLRPVGRRSIGGPGEELDEQLTVERSIERMVPTPVLRPAESRWLDLALVVDTHHSMLLWADHVDELRRVFTRSGVFRDVRTWQLTGTGPGGAPMLTRGRGGPPRNPLELADPAGRRLILVLSDTVAGGWRQGPLQAVLRHWCGHNAVAVLNVLPERLWTRGAVRPVTFAVRADRPAAATRSWQQVPVARLARLARTGRRRAGPAVVPVVGIGSGSLARLVRVVSGDGRWRRLACLRLDAEPASPGSSADEPGAGPGAGPGAEPPAGDGARTALEAVERFRASASPTAQQLAAHLAAVPLTLPVMTLVRRSLLRDSEHGHLAEVALGGLFAPWGDTGQSAEEAEFAFLPGVREALLGSQLRGDVAAVRELVRRRVWEFMSRNRGTGPDFSATAVTAGKEEGRHQVPAGALPFAARPQTPVPQPPPLPDRGLSDRGLSDRVVRVRYDAMREPQDVGTLLTRRLVLTVGDAALARTTVAWVRASDREIPCRSVWWDDALPRMVLLLADEDLADEDPPDAAVWRRPRPSPSWEALRPRVRVDGRTDQGEPVALTGEVTPYEGSTNGELVRLSTEPESWTQYRGAPVSRDGELIGVVHGVWPDRMVFLSVHALFDQPGFQRAVAAHLGEESARPPEPMDPGLPVCMAASILAGVSIGEQSPGTSLASFLRVLMRDTATTGRVIGDDAATELLVVLDPPGALGGAGRMLSELPRRFIGFAERNPQWIMALGVGVSIGETGVVAGSGTGEADGPAVAEATGLVRYPAIAERRRWPKGSGALRLAVSSGFYVKLHELLGPGALYTLEPLGSDTDGWLCTGDLAELGQVVVEADEMHSGHFGWPRCEYGAPETDRLGCRGVRIPGYNRCLAHLDPAELAAYLGTLGPGSDVDFRGTTFEEGLLKVLLEVVREPGTRHVRLGQAAFDRAHFVDDWNTGQARFTGRVSFTRALFAGRALFDEATFAGPASFDRAVFAHSVAFDRTRFATEATFRRTVFGGAVGFTDALFEDEVSFSQAVLEASADLNGMRVLGSADFTRTVFHGLAGLSGAVFAGPATFAHATWTRGLLSTGAVFEGPASFAHASFEGRVRFDGVSFRSDTNVELPSAGDPSRWSVERLPDRVWHLRLLDTGPPLEE